MSADLFTALLLLTASAFTGLHAVATWRARSGKGASQTATLYFAGLCLWQAINFNRLDQSASCAASILFFVAHIIWLGLQIRFRKTPDTSRNAPSILEIM